MSEKNLRKIKLANRNENENKNPRGAKRMKGNQENNNERIPVDQEAAVDETHPENDQVQEQDVEEVVVENDIHSIFDETEDQKNDMQYSPLSPTSEIEDEQEEMTRQERRDHKQALVMQLMDLYEFDDEPVDIPVALLAKLKGAKKAAASEVSVSGEVASLHSEVLRAQMVQDYKDKLHNFGTLCVKKFIEQLRNAVTAHGTLFGMKQVLHLIPKEQVDTFNMWVRVENGEVEKDISKWTVEHFIEFLLKKCPNACPSLKAGAGQITADYKKLVIASLKNYSYKSPHTISELTCKLTSYASDMVNDEQFAIMRLEKKLNKLIMEAMKQLKDNDAVTSLHTYMLEGSHADKLTYEQFVTKLLDRANEINGLINVLEKNPGLLVVQEKKSDQADTPIKPKKHHKQEASKQASTPAEGAAKGTGSDGKPGKEPCPVCGRIHPLPCFLKDHPDGNRENKPFKHSTVGKKWIAKGMEVLPRALMLNGEKWKDAPAALPTKKGEHALNSVSERESMMCITEPIETQALAESAVMRVIHGVPGPGTNGTHPPQSPSRCQQSPVQSDVGLGENLELDPTRQVMFDDCSILAQVVLHRGTNSLRRFDVNILIDTGSNPYNYCNYRVKELAIRQGSKPKAVSKKVRIAGKNQYIDIMESVVVKCNVYNIFNKKMEVLQLECLVVDLPKKDLIIGLDYLEKNTTLKQLLFNRLYNTEDMNWLCEVVDKYRQDLGTPITSDSEARLCEDCVTPWICDTTSACDIFGTRREIPKQSVKNILAQRLVELDDAEAALATEISLREKYDSICKRVRQRDAVEILDASSSRKKRARSKNRLEATLHMRVQEQIDEEGLEDLISLSLPSKTDSEKSSIPTCICGDASLITAQTELCTKYEDCFSRSLRAEAALVPPMELSVADGWDTRDNRRPPRPQGPEKESEIKAQTEKMLDAGVIRLSTASAHSQVLLIPKPDGSWRFCIDYRRLNVETKLTNWPIPNIPQMLRRLGDRKPKLFGIIDLTKGYYQTPLSEASKHYSAFITACALYEWNRVPMGLMGAPSYFQKIMTTHVLAGLMYTSCEVYMDDIIIFGSTQEEYLKNLELVLQRLRRFRLTGNPDKTRLGLERIEYVGHVIDAEGMSFERGRLQQIIDFATPTTAGELKSFIGLANYVRDNIPHMSELTAPLTAMLPESYNKKMKNRTIDWTNEATDSFVKMKDEINKCQKLFFMEQDVVKYPVHLYTDASLKGIGAYLCQIVNGQQRVIAFMSKTLTATQQRWSTPEREAFAIYEAFRKFEYLLRDVHFVLHTDHANLVHIRDTGSAKVVNWKLLIQEFDFEVYHIKGEENIVADLLSRNPKATVCEEVAEKAGRTDLSDLDLGTNMYIDGNLFLFDGIIPDKEYAILQSVHNSTVGHNGVDNTMFKLKSVNHNWKHMREMVEKFVRECDCCQKNTTMKVKNHSELFTTVGMNLMENLSIDSIGPLEADRFGNTHMIVVIDKFSRWLELYPAPGADAISAARALVSFYGRFGTPKNITSDNGKEYCNALVKEFHKQVGVNHDITVAYSHEENGVVERANREVRRYLNDICYDRRLSKSSWSDNIPLIMRIHNSLPKELTKCSPAHMLYAGSLSLNQKLFKENIAGSVETLALDSYNKSWDEWMKERQLIQRVAIETAQAVTKLYIDKHKQLDTGKRTEYPIGSFVLKSYPISRYGGGKPSKQDMNLTGPYEVVNYSGRGIYVLKDINSNKIMKPCHVSLLRPYDYDKARVDPMTTRLKDTDDMYIVESVISHRGSFNYKNTCRFTVKWEGYEELTEVPWCDIRDNVQLHEYLKRTGNAKHIPKKILQE